eukprot:TRINITY_DN123543_c0_g1_i1.p1 TRINITY_DN123543_c0_g1~~TRINITY_DN123543_c0_g1_i1.p1  ORF type:complete len:288 (+),score=113.06 TRINITY_DN123543_c0_g1_i1:128-991(+)
MNGSGDGFEKKIEEYKARERIYGASLLELEAERRQLRRMAADVLDTYGDVSQAAVRNALADPAHNMEVLLLRQKLRERDTQIRQLKDEAEANRFDQQTPAGQALMRRCKALLLENNELGKQMGEDSLNELKQALEFEKRLTKDMEDKLNESVDFTKELQTENEKLQGTLSRVAGRLREAKVELQVIKKEKAEAKSRRKRLREQQKAEAGSSQPGIGVPPPALTPMTQVVAPPVPTGMPQANTVPASLPTGVPEKKKKEKKEKDDEEKKAKKAKKDDKKAKKEVVAQG